jgi:hypothetical protein
MLKKLPLIAVVALFAAACDPDDEPFQIFVQPSLAELTGVWVGTAEITNPNDIGSNVNFGDQDRGFSFPVVIHLRADRTFTLTTANFPTSYDDDASRLCVGSWIREDATLQFFAVRTCRALPLTRMTIGRSLGARMTLEASTQTLANPLSGAVKVLFTLSRE